MMTDFSSDPLFGSFFSMLYKKRFSLIAMLVGIGLSIIIFHSYQDAQKKYQYFASEYFFKYCQARDQNSPQEREYYFEMLKKKYPSHLYTAFTVFEEMSKEKDPKSLKTHQEWLEQNSSFFFITQLSQLSTNEDLSSKHFHSVYTQLLNTLILAEQASNNKDYDQSLSYWMTAQKTASLTKNREIQIYIADQIHKNQYMLEKSLTSPSDIS